MPRIAPIFALIAPIALTSGCDTVGGVTGNLGHAFAPEDAALEQPRPRQRPASPPSTSAAAPAPGVSGTAIWDGQPSLGGIWVAHPSVDEPQRVRISHDGRSVDGWLFARAAPANSPPLQVSSEAAAALGLTAGTAAELTVAPLGP